MGAVELSAMSEPLTVAAYGVLLRALFLSAFVIGMALGFLVAFGIVAWRLM